jgi:RNA polymerase sigma factor (sigma-70 family)
MLSRNCGNTVPANHDISYDGSMESERMMTNDWPEIVNCHATLVVGSVRRILGNDHDAEDVVQDIFLEAYQVSHKMIIRNWAGFLHHLATRRAIDRLRKRVRGASGLPAAETDAAEVADPAPLPYQEAIAGELAERLRIAISNLPQGQAEVFSMRCFEEMTYDQIADALEISTNAVGLALHKARARLQALLAGVITPGGSP